LKTHRESFVLESNHISVRTKPSEVLLERKKEGKIGLLLGNVVKEKEKKNWVTTRERPFVVASRGILSKSSFTSYSTQHAGWFFDDYLTCPPGIQPNYFSAIKNITSVNFWLDLPQLLFSNIQLIFAPNI
jgi:hypothetical protein